MFYNPVMFPAYLMNPWLFFYMPATVVMLGM